MARSRESSKNPDFQIDWELNLYLLLLYVDLIEIGNLNDAQHVFLLGKIDFHWSAQIW